MRRALVFGVLCALGCGPLRFGASFFGRSVEAMARPPRAVPNRVTDPRRPGARLAVLWVGHATALVQMDDRFVLTDPVFTRAVGQLSPRLVEPGIAPEHVPQVTATVISHMHFDHLSVGSLELLGERLGTVFVPSGALGYIPTGPFGAEEVSWWQSATRDGMRVTAVPVQHAGWRYGLDIDWMTESFTGWVFEYQGLTVYFGGDSAYAPEFFRATRRRFPHIDLALLPIAPIHPREIMASRHMDPDEALRAFDDLGARYFVPIHFDTFINSRDREGEARERLAELVRARHLEDRVHTLSIGELRVLTPREVDEAPPSH